MNNKKPSKLLLITLIVLIQSLLIGAGWFVVGLRNVDDKDPFVKITALVGGSGMPDPSKQPQTEQELEEDKIDPTEELDKDNNDNPQPKISSEIKVKVRGTSILINDGMTPESAFETRFNSFYDKSKQVILIDDYADYQTYSKLLSFFSENGIKVKEEQSQK